MGATRHFTLLFLACLICAAQCRQENPQPPAAEGPAGAAPDGSSVAPGPAGGRIDTRGLVEVPDPLAADNPVFHLPVVPAPAVGEEVPDAAFHTSQRRVVKTEGLRHEYSRFDPFNADLTLVLLQLVAAGEWRVCRASSVPYDRPANLVRTLDISEPRWDSARPELIWGLMNFTIVTVDVLSGQITVVKDFATDPVIAPILAAHPDLYRVTTFEEGEASIDRRYWALLLQGSDQDYRARYLFTWDRLLDRVPGIRELPATESRIDWVGMSPTGSSVLIGADYDNGGALAGLTLADRELTRFHRLDYGTGHSDVGFDSDGREVAVMQNVRTDCVDLIPLDAATRPIMESNGGYDGTGHVPLVRLHYAAGSPLALHSGVHISCNCPGWCVISTYTEPNEPEQNWLDRTVILVRLDRSRPRAFYLAKVHGTRGAYWEETQATITGDGSRVVWATNWGRRVGQERVWLMELRLPLIAP